MRILIYKRTHVGDPDARGRFGIHDCMGRVRALEYDAVIGVGGIGPEPKRHGIAAKLNWVGIGPSKKHHEHYRGPVVTFKRFSYYGAQGAPLHIIAPMLARRMYEGRARYIVTNGSGSEQREAERIVKHALRGPARRVLPNKQFQPTNSRCARICG